jgi:hypothetical protein
MTTGQSSGLLWRHICIFERIQWIQMCFSARYQLWQAAYFNCDVAYITCGIPSCGKHNSRPTLGREAHLASLSEPASEEALSRRTSKRTSRRCLDLRHRCLLRCLRVPPGEQHERRSQARVGLESERRGGHWRGHRARDEAAAARLRLQRGFVSVGLGAVFVSGLTHPLSLCR